MRVLTCLALLALAASSPYAPAQSDPPKKPPEKKPEKPPEKKPEAKTELKASKLVVTMPEADEGEADFLIEDKPTKAKGTKREFETKADLDPAEEYEYKLTAKYRPNNYTVITRTKTVKFKGGDTITVDMTKASPDDKVVIRFVPTPDDIIQKMIALAKVTKDDVVYEPGCGDADITIAAIKAGAKKGVGIDIDPERVTEAKAKVKAAGLEKKIDIRLGDALDIKDFGDASVVFLYMGNEFDMAIRPKLFSQLKVGTRVVSHRFLMGDWKPEKTETITGADGDDYQIHLWTITEEVKKKGVEKGKKEPEGKKPEGEKKEKK